MTIRMWKGKRVTGDPKVSLVVASYLHGDARRVHALACLLHSLLAQTYRNWEALVVHDGPYPPLPDFLLNLDIARIRFLETPERKGAYGHPWRRWGIDQTLGQYVGLSNDDNYYAPVYFEWMLSELQAKKADLVYCDMVHSHRRWGVITAKPARGFIDVGNWLAAAPLAKSTPWTDTGFAGDWTYFQALQQKARQLAKVSAPLFVHN